MSDYEKQPLSEKQIEMQQQRLFAENAPFYHLHTAPLEGLLFETDRERKQAINFMGILSSDIEILAYQIMSNHLHGILRGSENRCVAFCLSLFDRLKRYLSRHGRPGVLTRPDFALTPITTLKQFRDEVSYVLRNAFVVRTDVNPLSDPWSTGFLYYNPLLRFIPVRPVSDLTVHGRRALIASMDSSVREGLTVLDDYIFPGSFVNYQLVESLFPNARKFLFSLFKNIESQVEAALRLGEKPILCDEELWVLVCRICRSDYYKERPADLNEEQRVQLAVKLKNRYFISNAQLTRTLKISPQVADTLFPLSANLKR